GASRPWETISRMTTNLRSGSLVLERLHYSLRTRLRQRSETRPGAEAGNISFAGHGRSALVKEADMPVSQSRRPVSGLYWPLSRELSERLLSCLSCACSLR